MLLVKLLLTFGCEALAPEPRLGDADMVVAFVVAVGGRFSSELLDMAAPELEGILPVSSSRLIRDFRSSSSSHTVDGAAVDEEDSLPSTPWLVSVLGMGSSLEGIMGFGTKGDE